MLLDSEGTHSTDTEGQHDNQIFILTVLLASVLIYNSRGVPKRNNLDQLKYPFCNKKVTIAILNISFVSQFIVLFCYLFSRELNFAKMKRAYFAGLSFCDSEKYFYKELNFAK